MNHTDYSKMSTAPISDSKTETVDGKVEVENETIILGTVNTNPEDEIGMPESVTTATFNETVEPTPSEPIEGFVSGCNRLNVRKEPKAGSLVVCTIEKDADVIIDLDESTDTFYKVCTEAGAEGYCMKDYITITQ